MGVDVGMNSPTTVTSLTDLPNIGKAMARDLQIVDIDHPKQLIGKDGYQLTMTCAA